MISIDREVLIIGAGPTGLALGAELDRLGVDVGLVDRRADAAPGSRAIGIHAPTLAALETSGVTERLLAHAARITRGEARASGRPLGAVRFDRTTARFPFIAAMPQAVTEDALREAAPAPARRTAARAVWSRPDHALATLVTPSGEADVRARVIVIATGARESPWGMPLGATRRRQYADRYLMTDLVADTEHPGDTAIIDLGERGVLESFPLPADGRRLVAWDPEPRAGTAHARAERLRAAVDDRDPALAERIETATAFGIRRSLVNRMRVGRLVLIGDAAHEVSPIGGQGMNLGILDAVTLAAPLTSWLADPRQPDALNRWEARRLASARIAARLANVNTAVGRGRGAPALRVLAAGVRAAVHSPLVHLAAHAYGMGFDRDAA